jgi:hypothetical protein
VLVSELFDDDGWVIAVVADYAGDLIVPKVDVKVDYWFLI